MPAPGLPFDPRIGAWFAERFGMPTEVQAAAWPRIASGQHVLATAPTGSGKTLTAFLWALDRLLTGAWQQGAVRVLYISPLKALNNDVQRNLIVPLNELRASFAARGDEAPEIRVMTRSGDTPQSERRRMQRKPPEILITTPESLNILLTSQGGRGLLGELRCVILDEIHAVASGKRGLALMTGVERLVSLSGEFQRIALSATVRPLERVARIVGGWQLQPESEPRFVRRPVEVVAAQTPKAYDLRIEPIAEGGEAAGEAPVWSGIAAAAKRQVRANGSTLIFANSRRLAERITRLLNEGEDSELAWAHHGSLSRELRYLIERRLKEGRLPAIVATGSLELGIDIGALDEVLLVETPKSIAQAVQRVGRAGHGVGEVSRARLYPSHATDLLHAAVIARAVLDGDIEEVRPVEGALDVLAQVILSMAVGESWQVDTLYDHVRTSEAYHELPREHFDRVIEMLAGRYADSRVRALRPRILFDPVDGTLRAADGAAHLLYTSGGTIPDRGYFALRVGESRAKIGELDEEFVWERSEGDRFVLGAQTWRVDSITHSDVLVSPSGGRGAMAPFWRAEMQDRSFHLAERCGRFLAQIETRLAAEEPEATIRAWLQSEHCLAPEAAGALIDHLQLQRRATRAPLPHRHHLLVERVTDPTPESDKQQMVLHTLWGGEVNRPLAMALAAAWDQRFGYPIDVTYDDNCLLLALPHEVDFDALMDMVPAASVEPLLRRRLENSGLFGARFREAAGRALLLPRGHARKRVPLWLTRLRSKKLLAAVSSYGDFPIVIEAWRSCLHEAFDLPALQALLDEVRRGEIRVTETRTAAPSPFAASAFYRQTNTWMYADDAPVDGKATRLRGDLVRELVRRPELRPRFGLDTVQHLEARLQRSAAGYAPRDVDELVRWTEERLLVPQSEWHAVLDAAVRDHAVDRAELSAAASLRLLRLTLPGGEAAVAAVGGAARLLAALGMKPGEAQAEHLEAGQLTPELGDALSRLTGEATEADDDRQPDERLAERLAEWLAGYGPLTLQRICTLWGFPLERLAGLLESLVSAERVVVDVLTTECDEAQVCDAENLESLMRLTRARARPTLEVLPLEQLPLWLALHTGLARSGRSVDDLTDRLEQLVGFPASAALWEAALLPARLPSYLPTWLDGLLQHGGLAWLGCGNEKLTFAAAEDRVLLVESDDDSQVGELLPPTPGRFGVTDLMQHSGLSSGAVADRLWQLAWHGQVSNDGFVAVRQGILNRFRSPDPAAPAEPPRRRSGRSAFRRWKSTRPFAGAWYRLPAVTPPEDALDAYELERERARLLLDRYGVIFRELLDRELPALRWSRLFRALRLMELSGEVVTGQFFAGVAGLQFAAHATVRQIQEGLATDAAYWMSAMDPASPCGLGLQDLDARLPRRLPGNFLSYVGAELLLVVERGGRDLTFHLAPDDARLPRTLAPLEHLLSREVDPVKLLEVDTINREPALRSPYRQVLTQHFGVGASPKRLLLERRRP